MAEKRVTCSKPHFIYQEYHPSFRKMEVESGWLYNFWDYTIGDFNSNWVFVPDEVR